MIKKIVPLFLAAAVISTAVYSGPKFWIEELIVSLGQPATWRALGTIKPGVENSVAHDIYRNSAVIAEVVQSAGVDCRALLAEASTIEKTAQIHAVGASHASTPARCEAIG